ncbi:hypothetical protein UFOVP582_6 [uncultured Caudovirales phage]|uniref:Uncharacterized protein n=3 Tax=uncultured Caudovirales phage TaxID=2100421 RepID=A0A6J5MWB9_9CAUD|nr:hypothetical protein UFOVP582_6 [uncultured Caudovirales phage]CAB4184262.1 hypothetical protein UFOVP1099_48 [uncultured Caudovirales phage]CAB5228730.1 hypothetical protein UFOVP1548_28 [uncultured Caudovirales phage]
MGGRQTSDSNHSGKKMSNPNNSDYDIPERKFDWQTDLKFGHKGETLVGDFLDAIGTGNFEVKTDRYRNGRMVLEMEQNPRLKKNEDGTAFWKPSGLAVTKAKWWVYVYTLDGSFVIVDVKRIKRYLKANKVKFNKKNYKTFAARSSNPTMGHLLEPEDVMDMMINKEYDELATP